MQIYNNNLKQQKLFLSGSAEALLRACSTGGRYRQSSVGSHQSEIIVKNIFTKTLRRCVAA